MKAKSSFFCHEKYIEGKKEKKKQIKTTTTRKNNEKSNFVLLFSCNPLTSYLTLAVTLLQCLWIHVYKRDNALDVRVPVCHAHALLCTRQFIVSTRYTYNACLRDITLCFNNCHTWQHQTKHVHWKVMACFGVMLPCF